MSPKKLLLLAILLTGFLFRFNNLNWDSDFHLQPDERFLTMIAIASQIPRSLKSYFDPNSSLLNPANLGFKFFVYGIFPITLAKIAAVVINQESYNQFTLLGRQLSAGVDLLLILVVYKTVEIFERKLKFGSSIKYWASFFYAISVFPIQLSHFFATDTFLNFFMFISFYFALRYWEKEKAKNLFFSALFLGIAVATKINAVFILPLILYFILGESFLKKKYSLVVLTVFIYGLISYLTLRFTDPYYFASTNFLNPLPNPSFVANIRELMSFDNPNIWYPPGVQWIHKTPILFSLVNLAVFGVGIPYFIVIITGAVWIMSKIKYQMSKPHLKVKNSELLIIMLWVLLFFLYQSTTYVKSIRYFIFIYPFLAIFAAFGVDGLFKVFKYKNIVKVSIVVLILIWPVMFSSIYLHEHTRVTASKWMFQNLPSNSVILGEYWDDPLPLPVDNTYGKHFTIQLLHVFDPDTAPKWQVMNSALDKADYYVLSSNRAWGSITTVPEKYPVMSKFYADLLAGKTNFKMIKEFTSYPKIEILNFKFQVSDDWAEETFTVYDHPKVMIFARQRGT